MKLTRAAAWVAVFALAFGTSACIKERLPMRGPLTALVLLNYQYDYLRADGRMPVAQDQVGGLVKATNKMIAAMRQQPLPVIYTLNEFSPFQPVDLGSIRSPKRPGGYRCGSRREKGLGPDLDHNPLDHPG